jgi:multidrug efflux pump subunit AcrB
MFINLKPRSERPPMKKVVQGPRSTLRAVAGINVYMQPVQNLQLGGRPGEAQFQYILQSVRADEINDWANKLQERLRADPLLRDVTSDSQLRALQAQLEIDRDRADTLGVSIDAGDHIAYACDAPRSPNDSPRRTGNSTTKRLPSPCAPIASTLPWCHSAIRRTIASPIPVPS